MTGNPSIAPREKYTTCQCECHDKGTPFAECCVNARSVERRRDQQRLRKLVLQRQASCQVCGGKSNLQLAHITPLASFCRLIGDEEGRAYANRLDNLLILCGECHRAQHRGSDVNRWGNVQHLLDHLKYERGWSTANDFLAGEGLLTAEDLPPTRRHIMRPCPKCGAKVGAPCERVPGQHYEHRDHTFHAARKHESREAAQ